MQLYPVPWRLVRDPATRRVVDAEGVTVNPHDPHWVRLLNDGDVTDVPPAAEPSPKKKAAASGEEVQP